ncbi:hypothetical protein [Aureivirga marina]|uniref:hypothetical protein n=1 Tax=Aureivirga marina TaxID=1182451 RepID=UPI0018C9D85D|nr:hypothetical protein [Aureivirga marina]
MKILIPEEVNFEISTTDLLVKYTERNKTEILLDVLSFKNYLKNDSYNTIKIEFEIVAEINCISLNFFEKYDENEFEIFKINEGLTDLEFWKENNYHPDSGFYQVDNSKKLEKNNKIYDPLNRLKLKHFLIVGADSYIEIIASKYNILKIE